MTRSGALVIGLVLFAALCTTAGAVVIAMSPGLSLPDSYGFRGFTGIFAVAFTWVGAALAWRRPKNAIGWILLGVGVDAAASMFLAEFAVFAVVLGLAPTGAGVLAGWLVSWIYVFQPLLVAVFLLLLFPDGHLLSPRWRPVAWVGVAGSVVIAVSNMFRRGPLENTPFIDNPIGLFDDPEFRSTILGIALVGAASIAAAASLFVRYRRSRGLERQQLRWLAVEGLILSVAIVASVLDPLGKAGQIGFIAAFSLAPVMIGIAVLRYQLYDLDVLINRALVYGTTTGAIAVAFFAGIVVLQTILRPFTGGSEIAVAVSTLASFALFQPLRGRFQNAVDRRFYRSRYDAARTLDAFSARLRDEVALDAVRSDLLDAVRDTVQPAHAGVWLRDRS
jgi:hypothetical protein